MVAEIKLYTSLPPVAMRHISGAEVGQAYLAECVASWRRAKFHVISLNSAEEIETLNRFGCDVDLRPIGGNRPTIGDFLAAIRDSGNSVAGIINADIFLSKNSELINAVVRRSVDGMVMLERINIDPVSLRPTGQSCNGFDAFVFRAEPLSRLDLDLEFLFGQPWWDYWLPLAYAAAGGKLMKVRDPILFHLDHPQKWNQEQWIANGQKIVRYFLRSTGKLPDEFVAEISKVAGLSNVAEDKLGPFSHWCFAKLRAMAESIQPAGRLGNNASLPTLVGFLDNLDGHGLIRELNEAQASIAAMTRSSEAMLEACDLFGAKAGTSPFARLSELLQRMSWSLLGKPISNYEDAFQTITAANHLLVSRKAVLTRFIALNRAWSLRKCVNLVTFWRAAKSAVRNRLHLLLSRIEAKGRTRLGLLKFLLTRTLAFRENSLAGKLALDHLHSSLRGPARQAVNPDALRLVIINHKYDQDIDAFVRARTDCTVLVVQHEDIAGVRAFFLPEPDLNVDYNGRWMRARVRRASYHFVRAAVRYICQEARPDVILVPSDVFFWVRPFLEEFRRQGLPVVVQDKEGTLAPGPMTAEHLELVLRHYPPIADRYYFWGLAQYEAWTTAGLDPAKIRIFGMPRSDFYYNSTKCDPGQAIGIPAGKSLITCFTFDADVYLTAGTVPRTIGRPWLKMRQELHAAMKKLAAGHPEIHVVVKCHPQSLEEEEIRSELAGAPSNLSILYGAATAAKLIVNSSVIIGFQSTALIEAMLTDRPLVYCAWAAEHDRFIDLLIPLPTSGGCFVARSSSELVELIGMLLDGGMKISQPMLDQRTAFTARYFADTRGSAADRILMDLAQQLVNRPLPPCAHGSESTLQRSTEGTL